MNVSMVLAAYNEEDIIAKAIKRCIDVGERDFDDYELILVDDGSKDATKEIMKEFSDSYGKVKFLDNYVNLNFGTSMLRGMVASSMEWVVPLGADLPFPPEDIKKYMKKAEKYDILVFQRVGYRCTPWRKVTSNLNNMLLHILFPELIKGTPVLNYAHIYRRSALLKVVPLARSPIFVQPEIDLRAKLAGLSIGNVKHRPDIKKVRKGAFGKPHDIIWGIYEILRFRLKLWNSTLKHNQQIL